MTESDNVVTGAPAVAPAGDMPLLTLRDYLQTTVRAGASDLFITVAAPPVVKVQGSFKALSRTPPERGRHQGTCLLRHACRAGAGV